MGILTIFQGENRAMDQSGQPHLLHRVRERYRIKHDSIRAEKQYGD